MLVKVLLEREIDRLLREEARAFSESVKEAEHVHANA